MLDYIAAQARRWRRRRRATRIQSELAGVGYTADDLARLADLRTMIDPDLQEATAAPPAADPVQPTLDDVLDVWTKPGRTGLSG